MLNMVVDFDVLVKQQGHFCGLISVDCLIDPVLGLSMAANEVATCYYLAR